MSAEDKASRRRGLGMGLSALLGPGSESYATEAARSGSQPVPIELLRPSPLQPRRHFDQGELETLAESIRERGILQPLLVRPCSGSADYEIVAGERRWRAAQLAGLHEVPAVIRELSDRDTLELALIENLQRADLSALDEAQAFRRLVDEFGHTQEEVATAIGRSRSHVANTLRLLALPAAVQAMVGAGELSAGHARALIGSADAEKLARLVVERGLNVRETEALVRQEAARPRQPRSSDGAGDPHVKELAERLTSNLGLEVGIRAKGDGGLLTIRYHDLGQLDGLIRRLG